MRELLEVALVGVVEAAVNQEFGNVGMMGCITRCELVGLVVEQNLNSLILRLGAEVGRWTECMWWAQHRRVGGSLVPLISLGGVGPMGGMTLSVVAVMSVMRAAMTMAAGWGARSVPLLSRIRLILGHSSGWGRCCCVVSVGWSIAGGDGGC